MSRAVASRVRSSSSNATHTCVNTTSLSTRAPSIAPMPWASACALLDQPVDERGHAVAAERAQRRPDRHAAGPPGELRHLLERVAGAAVVLDQVAGRARPSRSAAACGSGDDRDAAVVRDVERLVRVGRPGVGALEPVDEVAQPGRRRGPEPERAVDVDPGAVLVGHRDRRPQRVERRRSAGCPPAGRRWSGRRTRVSAVGQRVDDDAALVVGGHRGRRARARGSAAPGRWCRAARRRPGPVPAERR